MSGELSIHLEGWGGVRRCVDALHACQDDAERFLGRALEDFDALAGRLLSREEAWSFRQRSAEEELARQREELARDRACALERPETPPGSGAAEWDPEALWQALAPRFEELLEETRRDRGALEGICASAESQVQSLAAALEELNQARQTLAEVREDWTRAPAETAAPADEGAERFREELEAAQSQREALEEERTLLENELELLRTRSAELTEQLATQKRESAEQQRLWSDEMRALRGVLQGLTSQIAEAVDRPAPTAAPAAASAAAPVAKESPAALNKPSGGADPVLDSVMAQFEMLQKDLARRRSAQPRTERSPAEKG